MKLKPKRQAGGVQQTTPETQIYESLIDQVRADSEPRLTLEDARAMIADADTFEKTMRCYDGAEVRQKFENLSNQRSTED